MILIIGGAFQGKLAYALKAYNLTEKEVFDEVIDIESAKAIALLESLRKHFNKEWIIRDQDLTAGILRGSL